MDRYTGQVLLKALKDSAGGGGAKIVLPVGNPVIALLRPVATVPDRLNPSDIKLLTEWRNRFVASFLTDFVATDTRTAKWLTDFVGPNSSKILFMVDYGEITVGNIGLDFINWETGYGEADNIVKGGESPSGLMKTALQTAMNWAFNQLGLTQLGVRVRSDNSALDFYRKVGFEEVKRIPLRRIEEPEMVRWVEDPGLENFTAALVHMGYRT